MNRQRGMSSLAMVLLILLLGSLMLNGLNQQRVNHIRRVTTESESLRQFAGAQSAMEWGRMHKWHQEPALQCYNHSREPWRACLRVLAENRLLLTAGSGEQRLWRGGLIENGEVVFSRHGWSDYCPQKDAALCELP